MPQGDREARLVLARALPDVPRWLETRDALLADGTELWGPFGEPTPHGPPSFVVREAETGLVCVVGEPPAGAIAEAASGGGVWRVVLVPSEDMEHAAAALPGWVAIRAVLHSLGDEPRLPEVPEGAVRMLAAEDLASLPGVPDDLAGELRTASGWSPVAAAFVGGRPVSFCYAACRTEGLWDISIDTVEGHRREGHAGRCVSYMIRRMRGKEPVWGAEETNHASMGLAARLGFVPVDELWVLHPPPRRDRTVR